MARKVRDATLDSREARRRLKVRPKPFYRQLDRGLHLGYRRLGGNQGGTWVARIYIGEQAYKVAKIGMADDVSDADGVRVLDFYQAQHKAREVAATSARSTSTGPSGGPYTVAAAMDAYLHFLDGNRKSAADAAYRVNAFILPALGKVEVAALTADMIRKWMATMARTPARVRTRAGLAQAHAPLNTPEAQRARKATVNRTLTVLKAALNRAWREGHVASNTEWARVEKFENADAARIRYLTVAEAKRLINGCDRDFRLLVQAALETGCRLGELTALTVADYHADSKTVAIKTSKSGKPRHVVLTDEGAAFFAQTCAGRAGAQTMLVRADGRPWRRSEQGPLITAACRRASITPRISFHGLRHTYASLAVMAGMPMMVLARNLGHSSTRMVEAHYGHLAPDFVAKAVRDHAPRFGFRADRKITTLR